MNLNRLVRLLFLCSCPIAFTGCGDSDSPREVDVPRDPMAYMSLSIAAVETSSGTESRADYSFEEPASDNEKIATMRFIIVDGDGRVEHNVSITQDADVKTAPRLFRVKPNEKKTVYLFANETSIPDDVMTVFSTLKKGEAFPADTYGAYTLTRSEGEPLFAGDQLIPMTETHEVEIGEPQYDTDGEPKPYESTLFVTRVAVKLSFKLNIADSYIAFDPSEISDITFNQVSDMEFLFPANTTYSPLKFPSSADSRIITAYSVPQNADTEAWTLTWQATADNRVFVAGPVYMPETKYGTGTTPYSITLPVHGAELTASLPNLPSLPRNTHVLVEINLYGASMACEVTVVPYTGVYLSPEFGIDRE